MKKTFITVSELKKAMNQKPAKISVLRGASPYCGPMGYFLGFGGIIYI